jgi:hypothetical protein
MPAQPLQLNQAVSDKSFSLLTRQDQSWDEFAQDEHFSVRRAGRSGMD